MTFSNLHLSSLSSSYISSPHKLLPPLKSPFDHTSHSLPPSTMASNSLHPLHHHAATNHRNHSSKPVSLPPSFLKTTTKTTFKTTFLSSTFSISSSISTNTAATSTANPLLPFDLLQQHLSAQSFREADDETRRLIIQLAGEAAQKRGYVFFSEVQFIPKEDLQAIDSLWRQHSNNRFGYSVQRKIWKRVNNDFTNFFKKVGWMKKLASTEVEQYNYKAFPDEFFWEMTDDTPEGHLPLTNALRGTQLLTCIFNHPAFEEMEEQEGGYSGNVSSNDGKEDKPTLGKGGLFKPNYSF